MHGLLAMFSDNDGHASAPETWAQIHRYTDKSYDVVKLSYDIS